MTLTTPVLTKITTFDPALETAIKFSYSGGQLQKKRLVIIDAATQTTAYDAIQVGMQLSYLLPADTLSPGQYLAQIQVFDFNDNSSALSDPVLFYCCSAPTLVFNGLPSVLNSANVTLAPAYSQAQNDPLSELAFYLYDKDKILLSQSAAMYAIDTYTFYGLKDGQTYYVRCTGVTAKGMPADTGYAEITVQYVTQPNNMIFRLTNHKKEGYISIDCNIIDVEYTVGGAGEYSLSDGEVVLKNGTSVTYDSGVAVSEEFSILVRASILPLNRAFLLIHTDTGMLALSAVCMGVDCYCQLSVEAPTGSYCRYVPLPKAQLLAEAADKPGFPQLSVDAADNCTAVFVLKRKNNLYSLKLYYEKNGVIINENEE